MSEDEITPSGFDAPVGKLEQDHLNRWPLARQIYNVATHGPQEWSTRIGVYGQWGSGKTSILKFVASIADQDEHIVVWFDPWGYSTKSDLWPAFVLSCFERMESKMGGVTAAGHARVKSYLKKAKDFFIRSADAVPGDAGTIASGALDFLKEAFAFGPSDLEKLRKELKGRRIVVLIDDLDRAAAELVPEILYALKEVLDISGFSFVCGFDPNVVGEVLGAHHKGFGDGLKFLDKIIDYPVWIPPPTADGLTKMALADRATHCDFIPEGAIRDVLDLLPENPRAIRQFVRLATLLKVQTARHFDHELRWPVILTANAIKVQFPMLAVSLLGDKTFFSGIGMRHTLDMTTKSGQEVDKDVEEHIENCLTDESSMDESSKKLLRKALRRICGHINLWLGTSVETVIYQTRIAESPHAVTEKEFADLLSRFTAEPTPELLCRWISEQARAQSTSEAVVASELVLSAVAHYLDELRAADEAFLAKEKALLRQKAKVGFQLLEALLLGIGDRLPALKSREWVPVEGVIEPLSRLVDTVQPVHRGLWPRTERLLRKFVKTWPGSLEKLLPAVRTIDPRRSGVIDGKEQRKLGLSLNKMLDRLLARVMTDRFAEAGFLQALIYRRGKISDMRDLLLDIKGALWTGQRKELFAVLRTAKSRLNVQEDAYAILDWMDYVFREQRGSHEEKLAQAFASDPQVMPAIWSAATARPFEGRHAYKLRNLPNQIVAAGGTVVVPLWWQPAIDRALSVFKKQAAQNDVSDREEN